MSSGSRVGHTPHPAPTSPTRPSAFDAFSLRIAGWQVSKPLGHDLALRALLDANGWRAAAEEHALIRNSDSGSQSCDSPH